MCMCVCMCTHAHVCLYTSCAWKYICVHVYPNIRMSLLVYACMPIFVQWHNYNKMYSHVPQKSLHDGSYCKLWSHSHTKPVMLEDWDCIMLSWCCITLFARCMVRDIWRGNSSAKPRTLANSLFSSCNRNDATLHSIHFISTFIDNFQ